MKVVHVLNDLSHGGAETFVFSLVSMAISKGFDVSILMLASESNEISLERKAAIEKSGGVADYAPGLFGFSRCLAREKADVIHCHNLKALILTIMVKAVLRKKYKIIFTQHTSYLKRRFYHRLLCSFVDSYIAICRKAAEDFKNSVPGEKVVTIFNGVEESTESDSSLRVEGKCNIGVIARFHPIKNHELLVDSIGILKSKGKVSNFFFTFIGDGPEIEKIKTKIKNFGCQDYVRFCGAMRGASKYIDSFDYLLLCSKNEGMPITILEALEKKTPVIATDVGGVSDLVMDSVNGFLCKSHDAKSLFEIIDVAGKAENLSKFDKYFATHDFTMTMSNTLEQHLVLYRSLLVNHSGPFHD